MVASAVQHDTTCQSHSLDCKPLPCTVATSPPLLLRCSHRRRLHSRTALQTPSLPPAAAFRAGFHTVAAPVCGNESHCCAGLSWQVHCQAALGRGSSECRSSGSVNAGVRKVELLQIWQRSLLSMQLKAAAAGAAATVCMYGEGSVAQMLAGEHSLRQPQLAHTVLADVSLSLPTNCCNSGQPLTCCISPPHHCHRHRRRCSPAPTRVRPRPSAPHPLEQPWHLSAPQSGRALPPPLSACLQRLHQCRCLPG